MSDCLISLSLSLSHSPLPPLTPHFFSLPSTYTQNTKPPGRSMSYTHQPIRSVAPERSSSHNDHIKNLAPLNINSHNRGTASSRSSVNGSIPSIPVPVNRPEMEMLSPLSPDGLTTTSMKAARKPVAGLQGVSYMYMYMCMYMHEQVLYMPEQALGG